MMSDQKAFAVYSDDKESDNENFEYKEVLSDKIDTAEETDKNSDCENCEEDASCDRCVMKEVLQELGIEYPIQVRH